MPAAARGRSVDAESAGAAVVTVDVAVDAVELTGLLLGSSSIALAPVPAPVLLPRTTRIVCASGLRAGCCGALPASSAGGGGRRNGAGAAAGATGGASAGVGAAGVRAAGVAVAGSAASPACAGLAGSAAGCVLCCGAGSACCCCCSVARWRAAVVVVVVCGGRTGRSGAGASGVAPTDSVLLCSRTGGSSAAPGSAAMLLKSRDRGYTEEKARVGKRERDRERAKTKKTKAELRQLATRIESWPGLAAAGESVRCKLAGGRLAQQ